ncbi:hypothetical protein LACWKB8_0360 [Lactobacillus sp. wkB8]|nr:hypothetical protein LACWKB8_0360 [Lactobacillus sp. wkB8]
MSVQTTIFALAVILTSEKNKKNKQLSACLKFFCLKNIIIRL